ncbi:hypothetical protein SAMN05878437_0033 [Vreelandella subglaciescola]|jgi:hypothetical protein|uniref:Uncharacterized protein n=1 Tax=Vreelandella subglaciescola TaxID=29571 RepID=A0A1M7E8X6_9GAMM|nr:hypothetical protein SAMN05878437_0033 [Halomonas subglaciescola]
MRFVRVSFAGRDHAAMVSAGMICRLINYRFQSFRLVNDRLLSANHRMLRVTRYNSRSRCGIHNFSLLRYDFLP